MRKMGILPCKRLNQSPRIPLKRVLPCERSLRGKSAEVKMLGHSRKRDGLSPIPTDHRRRPGQRAQAAVAFGGWKRASVWCEIGGGQATGFHAHQGGLFRVLSCPCRQSRRTPVHYEKTIARLCRYRAILLRSVPLERLPCEKIPGIIRICERIQR